MRRLLALTAFAGASLGALLEFFFDPASGNRRRKLTRDRTLAFFRRGGRRTARLARGAAAGAYGASRKVAHLKEEEKPQPDDVTLARKVESEIFRDADAPKGQVSVNAEEGVVYLRGEVERPETIRELEEAARKVMGVRGVENLLHAPGEPAPMKQ